MLGGTDLLPDGANHSPASELDESPSRNLKKSARRALQSGFNLRHLATAAVESEGEEGGEDGEQEDIVEGLLESSDGLSEDSSESKSDAGELSTWYILLSYLRTYMHVHMHMHVASRHAHAHATIIYVLIRRL